MTSFTAPVLPYTQKSESHDRDASFKGIEVTKLLFFQIELGATTVRVGSTIFGARPPKAEWNKQ